MLAAFLQIAAVSPVGTKSSPILYQHFVILRSRVETATG